MQTSPDISTPVFSASAMLCMLHVSADPDAYPVRSVSLHGSYIITWCPGQFTLQHAASYCHSIGNELLNQLVISSVQIHSTTPINVTCSFHAFSATLDNQSIIDIIGDTMKPN